jgi:hypothetical protein
MAYTTRRKSVNLSLLGIHVPRPLHPRSPPSIIAPLPDDNNITNNFLPPQKKLKTSHLDIAAPDTRDPLTPSLSVQTPPASPPRSLQPQPHHHHLHPRVDTSTINDEVVVATIELLEKHNNRPMMLKELAASISTHVHVVET